LEKPPTDDDSGGKGKKKREPSLLEQSVKSVSIDATLCQAEITFKANGLQKMLAQGIPYLEKELKLRSKINITNMVLFDRDQQVKRYGSINSIIREYCEVRLEFYTKRKEMLLQELDFDLTKARNRYRFINEVMDKKIVIERKNKAEIWKVLEKAKFPQLANKFVYNHDMVELQSINPDEDTDETLSETKNSYNYLLDMRIWSFSNELLEKLKKLIDEEIPEKMSTISAISEKEMWRTDLDKFEKEYLFWIKAWYKESKLAVPRFQKSREPKKLTKMKLTRKLVSSGEEEDSASVGAETITV
jgi:DNA topoisomerase-2